MKFDLDAIDKTFTTYKKGQMFDGVVVTKREDGVIFNIGGKNDAYISAEDFEDYEDVKIGDRFKVVIINQKNEEGLIEASKSQADTLYFGNQNAQKLRLGSKFSFVATGVNNGLTSKMGEFSIFVPADEVSIHYVRDLKALVGKQFEGIVTEYNKEEKKIIASIKMLQEQIKEQCESVFWKSIFINKIVDGKVKKILPYGIFVDVDGVDCFCHISNLSYEKLDNPSQVVKEGDVFKFRVIEVDRDKQKVALGLKQLQESPKTKAIKELLVGEIYAGEVIKILQFGAIIKLENGATGLLHISNATDRSDKNIYEIVKLNQKVQVEVLSLDIEEEKVAFKLK